MRYVWSIKSYSMSPFLLSSSNFFYFAAAKYFLNWEKLFDRKDADECQCRSARPATSDCRSERGT